MSIFEIYLKSANYLRKSLIFLPPRINNHFKALDLPYTPRKHPTPNVTFMLIVAKFVTPIVIRV